MGQGAGPARRARAAGFRAAGLLAALAAGGCASLAGFSAPPAAIYDLSAPQKPGARSGTPAQILVPEPAALKSLDTERIAARPTEAEYAYLPGALWADRLPRLLQARLLETLQNTPGVKAVGLPGQGLLINYQVILDVRRFEIADEGAVAAFNVKLLDDTSGRVVASRIVRATAPVAGNLTNPAAVAALDTAMDEAFVEITRWVLAQI